MKQLKKKNLNTISTLDSFFFILCDKMASKQKAIAAY